MRTLTSVAFLMTVLSVSAQCLIANFEGHPVGANGTVLFRVPNFSGSTSGFLASTGGCNPSAGIFNCAQISNEQAFRGNQSLKVVWQWNGNPNAWLRLTTYLTSITPNPAIDFQSQRIVVRLYVPDTTPDFYLTLGVRETATQAVCHSNGGITGSIEWVGAESARAYPHAPIGKRISTKNRWVTVVFDPQRDPILGFAGNTANGILETLRGTLEHLAFTPVDPQQTGPYVVYIDEVATLPRTRPNFPHPWIFGMHEPGGEYVAEALDKRIWILFTEGIGSNPNDHRGGDYRLWANAGHGVIVRLNYGYNPQGTLPPESEYANFAQRVANYVSASPGAHIWIIGNEPNLPSEWPGGYDGEPITVQRYLQVFRMCRNAIKSLPGHENDLVLPAPIGTYAPPFPEKGIPGFLDYWTQMITALGEEQDGFVLHAYTHGTDPELIFSNARMGPPYEHIFYHFRVYRNYLAQIPPHLRLLPVFITETNMDQGWPNINNGWIKNAYREINDWNSTPGSQLIYALCPYRWPPIDPYYIQGKENTIQDWREAMMNDYRWDTLFETVRGDVNADGCVDDSDLLAVLFAFGYSGDHPADLNRNGLVDDSDLLVVLFEFGNGC